MAETPLVPQKKRETRKRKRNFAAKAKTLTGVAPTPMQLSASAALLKELMHPTGKSLVQVLIDSGYSEESARQWTNVMAGIRPLIDPFVERLQRHRDVVMSQMEKKIKYADYGDLTRSLNMLIKNERLLSGKSTHNFAVQSEKRKEIDRLIDA